MNWNNGSGWYWMAPMMLAGTVLIGAVVFGAVRLATHDSRQH